MGYASFGLVKFEYDDDYDDDFLYTETQRHGVYFLSNTELLPFGQ